MSTLKINHDPISNYESEIKVVHDRLAQIKYLKSCILFDSSAFHDDNTKEDRPN